MQSVAEWNTHKLIVGKIRNLKRQYSAVVHRGFRCEEEGAALFEADFYVFNA